MNKKILLGILVVLILGSIVYLEMLADKGELSQDEKDAAVIKVEEIETIEEPIDGSVIEDVPKGEIKELVVKEEPKVMFDEERVKEKEEQFDRAKELIGIVGYLNGDEITITENIGKKVILIDFWTYSCINCQRTLPYINAWHEKYEDEGLLIIGVHTPEFDFEKDYDNVLRAIEKFEVNYPVVQDNDFKTWRAYGNRYWPRKYLIDIDGFIVYDHIGEGRYQETEDEIRQALNERKQLLDEEELVRTYADPNVDDPLSFRIDTKELYFGYKWHKRESLGNDEGYQEDKLVSYSLPTEMKSDKFYLEGDFHNYKEYMTSYSEGKIILNYKAKNVNMVLGSEEEQEIEVYLDGEFSKTIKVKEETLYKIVEGDDYSRHDLEIRVPEGVEFYTFTFG